MRGGALAMQRIIGYAVAFIVFPLATAALSEEADDLSVAEFEGKVVAAREAEVTPIVSGWLKKINFAPGQFVQKGDTLFEFSLTSQKLKINLADAHLARAQASLRNAEAALQRAQELASRNVASKASLLEAEAARDIASADVAAATASLELQKVALMQLTQKAPFAGMMSAPLVKENGWQDISKGHIAMAVITQLDPILVVAEVPYSIYATRRAIFKTDEATKEGIVLSIILPGGEVYPHQGQFVSGGHQFDETTQKLTVWGKFANPDHLLRPGLKVAVHSRIRKE
jgi:RND family efflux transporter MFP subunit